MRDDDQPPYRHNSQASAMSKNSSTSSWSFADAPLEQALEQQHVPGSGRRHIQQQDSLGSASTSVFGRTMDAGPLSNTAVRAPEDPGHGEDQSFAPFLPSAASTHRYRPDTTVGACLIPQVEKEPDDPSQPTSMPSSSSRPASTLSTLNRLFAVQADVSPEHSRHSSYIAPARHLSSYTPAARSPAALSDHLYKRGFLDGRHSDITVHAFGQQYRLHRLMLDRAPFFSSALSEPW